MQNPGHNNGLFGDYAEFVRNAWDSAVPGLGIGAMGAIALGSAGVIGFDSIGVHPVLFLG
jgi:hypothetical protein